MSEKDGLQARINELEEELAAKEREMIQQLDRIEHLEDEIMRLEKLIPDDQGNLKGSSDSKLAIQLDDKDRQIREFKDKLGYLRKEKIQLQQELERVTKEKNELSVATNENKMSSSTPLDALVNELQGKINKQRLMITKLKQQAMGADAAELNEKLRLKENEVDDLKKEIEQLNARLEEARTAAQAQGADSIRKGLTEELQTKLNKAKREIGELKEQLTKQDKKEKPSKKEIKPKDDGKLNELLDKVDELKEEISQKENEIAKLKTQITELKEAPQAPPPLTPSGPASGLTDELQSKLNKARAQIKNLEKQLAEAKAGEINVVEVKSQIEEGLESELEKQKQLVQALQDQILKQSEELGIIQNESTQIKIKCEDLQNQVKLKEQKIGELKKELLSTSSKAQSQMAKTQGPSEPVALRLRELKSLIDDLSKQNIQQRLEISQLRKI